jgi:hypothetical protein
MISCHEYTEILRNNGSRFVFRVHNKQFFSAKPAQPTPNLIVLFFEEMLILALRSAAHSEDLFAARNKSETWS